ncbi:MAG: resuscitation-promoting factor RpfA [Actinomycetota bacterium]|nr:resuscitation-promoting factor RpfA [Actinomycetota bacterium]
MTASRQALTRLAALEVVIATALVAMARWLDVGVVFAGRGWWMHAGTADLAIVLIWWTAAALAAWTAITTTTCLASRTVPRLRGLRALDACTLPFVRRAVDYSLTWTAITWTLAVTCAGTAIAAPAYARSAPASAPGSTAPPAVVRVTPDGEIVVAPRQEHASTPAPAPPSTPTPTTTNARPATAATTVHVVVAGDNLWRIASERLAGDRGIVPSDAVIAPYWSRVVDANRATLRSGDPNLIFPGEVVDLPPRLT